MKTPTLLLPLLCVSLFFTPIKAQWAALDAGDYPSQTFYSIAAVDEQVAWGALLPFNAAGTQTVARTTNGGESWETITINESSPDFITFQIFALDENTAWAVRSRASGQDRTEILKTVDGGASWEHQTLPSSNEHTAAVAVHFFDEQEGVSFAETFDGSHWKVECYYTEDGGANWALADNANSMDERIWIFSGNNHYEVIGDQVWFGTSLGRVFRSNDRGKSWSAHSTPLTEGSINSIAFKDGLQGIALSSLNVNGYPAPNQAFRTINGGKSWIRCPVPPSPATAQIEFVPGSKGAYVLHGPGYLPDEGTWVSVDNGNHWKSVGHARVDCIQFVSPSVGWAGGVRNDVSGAELFRWEGSELLFDEALINVKTIAGSGIEGHRDGPAATARFSNPMGMDMDAEGNLYIADDYNHCIRKLSLDGMVTTFAGNGKPGYANGPGNQAQFNRPQDVVVGPDGSLFVADANNFVIRKITPDGKVSLYAGIPGSYGGQDGPALEATFGWLPALGVDDAGNLYTGGENKIRKITPERQVSTLANTSFVWGLYADGAGNVYYANFNQHTIRRISPDGTNTLIDSGSGCMDGTTSESSFSEMANITADPYGNIYLADGTNHRVRKIDTDGTVMTLAGDGCQHGYGTEYEMVDGPAELAQFGRVRGIFYHPNGNLLVTSWDNDAIRELQVGVAPLPVAALEHQMSLLYPTMPKHHISPIHFTGFVFNVDESDVEGVALAVRVKKDGITVFDQSSVAASISSYTAAELSIESEFMPEESGEYEVVFSYSTPGFGVFFTAQDHFVVNDTLLGADDGQPYAWDSPDFYGENAVKSYGQEYFVVQGDTLAGVSIHAFMEDATFSFAVYQMKQGALGEKVYTSETFTDVSAPVDTTTWFPFATPFYVPPGQYLFALERTDPSGTLGLAVDTDRNDRSAWHKSPIEGVHEWDRYFHGWNEPTAPVFMLRPVFQAPIMTPAREEAAIPFAIHLAPNPASDHLLIRIGKEPAKQYQIELLNLTGQVIKHFTARGGEPLTTELQELSNGPYLLKVNHEGAVAVRKFVKQ